MSAKRTSKSSKTSSKPTRGRADLAHLREVGERDIERTSPPELADLPASFWDDAVLVHPVAKQPISLRLDSDVLDWFKEQGPRYQSRMNAVLRAYMSAARLPRSKGAA
ncbi:MAG: BrnA antitoxin family protein [Deltaproteobacteria bacterium]|nr:BrnA antitoxin family protein [Deltaproteobacteria bacterium]